MCTLPKNVPQFSIKIRLKKVRRNIFWGSYSNLIFVIFSSGFVVHAQCKLQYNTIIINFYVILINSSDSNLLFRLCSRKVHSSSVFLYIFFSTLISFFLFIVHTDFQFLLQYNFFYNSKYNVILTVFWGMPTAVKIHQCSLSYFWCFCVLMGKANV